MKNGMVKERKAARKSRKRENSEKKLKNLLVLLVVVPLSGLMVSCSRLEKTKEVKKVPLTNSKTSFIKIDDEKRKYIGDFVQVIGEKEMKIIGKSRILNIDVYVGGRKVYSGRNPTLPTEKIGYGKKELLLVIETSEGKKFIKKNIIVDKPGFKFKTVKYGFDEEKKRYEIELDMGKENLMFNIRADFPIKWEYFSKGEGKYKIIINSEFAGPIEIYAKDGKYTKKFDIDLTELFDESEIIYQDGTEDNIASDELPVSQTEIYRLSPEAFRIEPKAKTSKVWMKYFTVRRIFIPFDIDDDGQIEDDEGFELEDAVVGIKPLRYVYACTAPSQNIDTSKCTRVFRKVRLGEEYPIESSDVFIAFCAISDHFAVKFFDGNSEITNFLPSHSDPSAQVRFADFSSNQGIPCFLHEFQDEITIQNFYESAAFNIIETLERGIRIFRSKVASRVRVYYTGDDNIQISLGDKDIGINIKKIGFARKFHKDILAPARDQKNNDVVNYGRKIMVFFNPYLKDSLTNLE